MKEHYIKDKVVQLAHKLGIQKKIDEVKLEKTICRIEHIVGLELESSLKKFDRHMQHYISQTIRAELLK